ncbi:MAG: TonB-dependent receptor [Alphaproteobacteria bacterium]|nr:TonB-dependent receptor [Alphaproteobacteria bacterium]
MNRVYIRNVLLGCASSLAFAPLAFAQVEDDGDQKDEIVVTGFRSSLENSVATKRNAKSIVEAVSAEDIGKLPDVSIAEALGRLPGLTTQRLNGRSQVLSIRGLGPDLSTALLNGREQVTTSDNRGVEFDQYPAELLSGAVVYKTPYAGLIGQGLAGTVDMQTIRPLDRDGRIISFNGRYEFNENGSLNPDAPGNGYRATATIVDQFMDDTIGISLGVAYQSSPAQIEQFNAWGYASDSAGNALLGGSKPFVASSDLDRIGLIGTLQYQPSDQFESTIDIFYSDFKEDQPLRGIEFPLGFGAFGVTTDSINSVEDGVVTGATFGNQRGVIRNDYNERRADLFSAGWNGHYDTDTWGVEMDISYSKADRADRLIETYAGTGFGDTGGAADTLTVTRNANGTFNFSPTLDYSNPSNFVLTDPLGWGGGNDVVQAGFINAPETTDELWHLRGSVDRDFDNSFISNIEIGLDYGMREKTRNIDQQFLTIAGGPLFISGGAIQTAPVPQAALLDETTGIGFLGIPSQLTYDPLYLLDSGFYAPLSVSLSSFSVAQDWTVNEDVLTGWVKFDVDTHLGSIPVTGNVGVQVVYTDQSALGFRIPTSGVISGTLGQTAESVEEGDTYTDFLPSLNLIFGLAENTQLRFGASRTLARARMDQLNASLSLGVDLTRLTNTDPFNGAFSANGGNPFLRPYISNQVDLSLEHYFGGAGYISLAAFYKDLNDFVNPADGFLFDFADFVAGELTPAQQATLGTSVGFINGPTNNGFGSIKGIELGISLPGELFSESLSSFGLVTSTSYTDSKVTLFAQVDPSIMATITVPGLSKWVVNSTLYYEQNGLEARVSHRFRSSFLAEVSAISATRTFRDALGESIIDAQIGYRFQSGPLEGLRVTAQGLNLTNEPFVTTVFQQPRQVIDHQSFGRTYLIGASYTF